MMFLVRLYAVRFVTPFEKGVFDATFGKVAAPMVQWQDAGFPQPPLSVDASARHKVVLAWLYAMRACKLSVTVWNKPELRVRFPLGA